MIINNGCRTDIPAFYSKWFMNRIREGYVLVRNPYFEKMAKELKNYTYNCTISFLDLYEKVKRNAPDCNVKHKNKICLWQGDITTLKIEAIVNAGNSQGLGCFIPCHKCIDNSIHSASGVQLRLECYNKMKEIGILETGKAFITKGYNLPSKYVIHTVGPIIYEKVSEKDIKDLRNCYINSLELARKNNIREIAFCSISTGEFRFPKDQASKIAIATIDKFLDRYSDEFQKIVFNVFTEEDYNIYLKNLGENYGEI